MTADKQRKSEEKNLKATVKKLRSRLEKADADAKQWKKEAARQKEAATESERQVKKLSKRLKKASAKGEPNRSAPVQVPQSNPPRPDASWTVLQLRAEARSRGLTGLSGKSKAELLDALG